MDEVKIAAVGDTMLGGKVNDAIERYGVKYIFGKIKNFIEGDSVFFLNLEMPFSNNAPPHLPHVHPSFRVSSEMVRVLRFLGVDVVNIGTNHIKDFGEEGIGKTITVLRKNGIYPIGAGMDEFEAREPVIIVKGGVKIGFLGYCKNGEYTANFRNSGSAPFNLDKILQDIRKLKPTVDVVVLSLHWGSELSEYPTPEQVKLAHQFIDEGSRIIIGHHPHVIQGIEHYHNGIIFYSLGNFLFDNYAGKVVYDGMMRERSESFVAIIKITGEQMEYKIVPLYFNENFQIKIAEGERREKILQKIKRISSVITNGNLGEMYFNVGIGNLVKREIKTYLKRFKKERMGFLLWALKNFKWRYITSLARFLIYRIKNKIFRSRK